MQWTFLGIVANGRKEPKLDMGRDTTMMTSIHFASPLVWKVTQNVFMYS